MSSLEFTPEDEHLGLLLLRRQSRCPRELRSCVGYSRDISGFWEGDRGCAGRPDRQDATAISQRQPRNEENKMEGGGRRENLAPGAARGVGSGQLLYIRP